MWVFKHCISEMDLQGPPKWRSISANILAIYLLIYHSLLSSLLLLFTILTRKFAHFGQKSHHLGAFERRLWILKCQRHEGFRCIIVVKLFSIAFVPAAAVFTVKDIGHSIYYYCVCIKEHKTKVSEYSFGPLTRVTSTHGCIQRVYQGSPVFI